MIGFILIDELKYDRFVENVELVISDFILMRMFNKLYRCLFLVVVIGWKFFSW